MRTIFRQLQFLVFLFMFNAAKAQQIPHESGVLKAIRTANQYFMEKWPDPGKETVTNKVRPSNLWTRAVYYEGLIGLYQVDPQESYKNYMLQWGEKHQWGLWGGTSVRNADNQCCGQTYLDLYVMDGKKNPERISAITNCINNMIRSNKIDDWNWIDAFQMAMPVFVKLGNIHQDSSYFRRMHEMYNYTKHNHGKNGLYNPIENLWWRDKDFVPPYKEPNGENCYWSRGNGWVLAALARVLDELPKHDSHREVYLSDFKDMCKAILPLQRKDGFWNASLKDPGHFGGKETTGTALFTYAYAWGIRQGILDQQLFLPAMKKAWKAMKKHALHDNGKIGFVQGTGKEPKDGQPATYDSTPDFEDFGLGCFLLAGSEIIKLSRQQSK